MCVSVFRCFPFFLSARTFFSLFFGLCFPFCLLIFCHFNFAMTSFFSVCSSLRLLCTGNRCRFLFFEWHKHQNFLITLKLKRNESERKKRYNDNNRRKTDEEKNNNVKWNMSNIFITDIAQASKLAIFISLWLYKISILSLSLTPPFYFTATHEPLEPTKKNICIYIYTQNESTKWRKNGMKAFRWSGAQTKRGKHTQFYNEHHQSHSVTDIRHTNTIDVIIINNK